MNLFVKLRLRWPFVLLCLLILLLTGTAGASTQMPEEVVGAGADDGHETGDPNCNEVADYVCLRYVADCLYGFVRFTGIPIAQGATIDGCTLFVDVYSTSYDDPNVDIFCEDTSSATTLEAPPQECVSLRNQTTASVGWEATGIGAGYQPSPELKTIVQEVISRDDWSSGNDLAFIFVVNDGSVFYTDTYEVATPAKLHIWYTTDGEPPAGNPRRRKLSNERFEDEKIGRLARLTPADWRN